MRTSLEFFAGGGMVRQALGPDWVCLLANDIDPKKAAAYADNFGHDHLHVCNVAALTTADIPGRADLAWMSAPCVGHSEAGNRQGFNEKQSAAFWEASRLIEGLNREGRVPWVIVLENVEGLLTRRKGESEAAVVAVRRAFQRAGYNHATAVIDAMDFVPQSRETRFRHRRAEELRSRYPSSRR
jgi:DNA (cytosine-5)-methyltransferase 1